MATELDTVEDLVTAGNAALARADWGRARRCFESALGREQSVAAWEGLSWATSWLGDTDASLDARERAFRAYRAAADVGGAVRMAGWLANDALHFRGDQAVAAGWLERCRSLLAGRPPSADHGWFLVVDGYYALEVDADPETAASRGAEAAALGAQLRVPDLEALGIAIDGAARVVQGRVETGLRRLDEAAAVCAGEEFELPISPAWTLCIMIAVCERLGDFARVAQWCEAMRSIGDRLSGRHLIGVCRSAYGQVLACRGEWPAAEAELVAALADLEATRPGMAPDGLARLGELRARQGRVEEARALFERALPHRPALIGLGVLALEEGDAVGAADIAERTLRRIGEAAPIDRVPALELLARARAALGDFERAGAASAELAQLVERLGTPYLRGRARLVAGEVAELRGDHEQARRGLEDALDLFGESAAPYEAALARLALARALVSLGRADAADAEARAARAALERLGAIRDARRSGAGAHGSDAPGLGELTVREREVLGLVAQGLNDAEIAERLVVSPHTVHRHVANVRTKLRLHSRAAAVAYATREGLL
ncbi:helix-turn-helix domain-containing protein [Conexibacter arvalis]|uniref:DNA-binding CsgD family transcriptional regulator n=1 Tax=Conexibacter arvalis TaxID=912552 RepID=A0A840ILT0_9ACTN|nr:helix-turn-helix transcriptional regulator [Conexibacter arvalis]MBB4665103.1 DNA-binding CsgD family transcriptional regulator [Conexibacter arvalis]